jgi:hypothetical protein
MSLIDSAGKAAETQQPAAGDQAAAASAATAQTADWTSSLPEELKGVVTTKGFKTPADVLQSYVNAEKLIGADKILAPKDGKWDKAALSKLGVPESPDKYQIKRPTLPEGMAYDEAFEKAALTKAHELGLMPQQVQSLLDLYAAQQSTQMGRIAEMQQQQQEATATMLKQEWGNAYQAKLENAGKAMRMIGGDALAEALIETGAGNHPEIVRAFAKIGDMLGEDRIRAGQPSGFNLTPEEARNEANRLMAHDGYLNKAHPEHAAIVQKVQALFRQSFPEG